MSPPRLLLLAGVLCLMGCDEYNVVVRNRSSWEKVYQAEVWYGNMVSPGGVLSNRTGGGVHNRPGVPIPKHVTVVWQTEDGTAYEKQVEVRSRLPRGFNKGDLIFTILDGGEVEFSFETWAEQDAREAERRRQNPPVFEEGELEIETVVAGEGPRTKGLSKWNHPELQAHASLRDGWDVLAELAIRIKRDGVRYFPGQRVEIEGQTVCFSEGEVGRLLVEPCAAPDPSP